MLVKIEKDYAIIDLPKDKIETQGRKAGRFELKLAGLDMQLDRHAEWNQIYNEAWRHMRDFFYAPNMNGVDWKAMRDKYAALVPFVNHRNDLTYLIGELIGELNNGHAYIGGGERPETPRIKLGLLGAEFSRDPATQGLSHREDSAGRELEQARPFAAHRHRREREAGRLHPRRQRHSRLHAARTSTTRSSAPPTSRSSCGSTPSRPMTARATSPLCPIADESPLYYRAWVQKNVDEVSKKTNGEVGYIHIPDMGQPGLNEFTKQYFPQIKKKGAHRRRARQRRRLCFTAGHRAAAARARHGRDRAQRHAANQSAADLRRPDGRACATSSPPPTATSFPYRFKAMGLGKLIGKRTWGGVVGIRNPLPLTDGGQLFRPEFAPYSKDGKEWVIEGHGVDPDIVVDNDPAKEFSGEDQQLDRAIQEIQKELKTKGYDLPPVPPYPNRNPTPPPK